MPTPTQHPGAPTPPENTAAAGLQVGAQFTPEQRAVIITELASGTPIRRIARMLGRPQHHVDRWAIRHNLHTRTRHSNHLVITLTMVLLGAGLSAAAVASLAGINRQTVYQWRRKYPVPATVEHDAADIRYYTALLSGASPAEAASSAGAALSILDPQAVYSSDVHTPIAQQNPGQNLATPPDHPHPTRGARSQPQQLTRTPAPVPAAPVSASPGCRVDRECPSTGRPAGPVHQDRRSEDARSPEAPTHGERPRARRQRKLSRSTQNTHHTRTRRGPAPSRRRGRHHITEPEILPVPTPVTRLPPPAIVHHCDQEQHLHARYLSAVERDTIAVMIHHGATQGAIARALGRSRSTISREITRNSNLDGTYNPFTAARRAAGRRARPRLSKVYSHPQLWALVAQGLDHQHSPEQIAHRIRRDFPDRQELHVCHETIYQALYVYPRGGLKKQVTAALRTGRAVRKPQGSTQRQPRITGMVNIIERPEDITNRLLPGDWEGDLICGEFNRSAIGTLVDRKTRYVMLLHLPGAHDAVSVRDAMIDRLSGIPEQIALSVTWDQGSEMAMHQDISAAVDIDVFFCDPHSPWQRGTNENTNGLLRQYFPKHTDLSVYTVEDLWKVERLMNNRPRKALDWATPAEAMWEELDGILGDA